MLLRRRGHEVDTAEDCAGARACVREQEYDVVVTDWRLPDGLAATFVGECTCPVLAVSGHPEEVARSAPIREVLAKPVRPAALLERIAACGALKTEVREPAAPLARPAQAVIDDVLAQLPDGLDVGCVDDGAFAVVRVRLPEGFVPDVRPLGGDLRIVEGPGSRELELRVCRDGRPAADTTVVGMEDEWPVGRGFAIDCSGCEMSPAAFSAWLLTVAEHDSGAGRICLLNVPEHLEVTTEVWETTHDMPMRERVGPRLSEELAELWG